MESLDVDIARVIMELEGAEAPNRVLDGYIGGLFGWRRKIAEVTQKVVWLNPEGVGGTVPHYTTSLDTALEMARSIVEFQNWACVWAGGKGRAVIEEGPPCLAITPPMAMCLAALKMRMANENAM